MQMQSPTDILQMLGLKRQSCMLPTQIPYNFDSQDLLRNPRMQTLAYLQGHANDGQQF